MSEERRKETNWTPIIVTGLAVGGLYLILRLFMSAEAEDRELAREILADWQLEFDQMKTYVETIYAGGRTPTEQETAILSAMLEQMAIKEITIQNLSKTVWEEAKDVIRTAAQNWWLVPAVIFTPIAGYATFKLVRRWFNNRRPPPNFPCPKCGGTFSSEEALKEHMDNVHAPTKEFALEAQQKFFQTSTWIQGAIAVESYYGNTYTNWSRWSLPEIKDLNWAITSAWVYTIGAASEAILLKAMLMMLLI